MISEITREERLSGSGKKRKGLVSTLFFEHGVNIEFQREGNKLEKCYQAKVSTRLILLPKSVFCGSNSLYETIALRSFVKSKIEERAFLRYPMRAKDEKEARQNHYRVINELKESYFTGKPFIVR